MNRQPSPQPFCTDRPKPRRTQTFLWSLLAVVIIPSSAFGQINSWTNPVSANWHELYWSLGVRPSSSQAAVYFTNANWKAVQIGAETANSYPTSLTVSNLFLGAPGGSSNTLLLNYAGPITPLRVLNQLTVGTNAALRLLASRLETGKQLLIEGTAYQEDESQASIGQLIVGLQSSGAYFLSSGLVSAGLENVGGTNHTQALFSQSGGTNQSGGVRVHAHAQYQFEAGLLRAGNLIVGDGLTLFHIEDLAGRFTQSGGQLVVTNDLVLGEGGEGSGIYQMLAGNLSADQIRLGTGNSDTGYFQQLGGTSQCRTLIVSEGYLAPWELPDTYDYSGVLIGGGKLITTESQLGAGRLCSFTQTGGVHEVSTSLSLSDSQGFHSYYTLAGGITHCQTMRIESSEFYQAAGTNQVTTTLDIHGRSDYSLSGGALLTDTTFISDQGPGFSFHQSGGLHVATNYLFVGYSPTNSRTGDYYTMDGGQLTTTTILLGGTFEHRGGVLTPTSIAMYGGRWIAGVPYQEFHQLDPRGNARTISSIVMATNPCILRFDSSVYPDWLGTLSIEQWSGNPNGAGTQQIRFGNDGHGLGPGHLLHTWFVDPAGFPPGLYQAKILSTGEIIPGRRSEFSFSRSTGQLVLRWDTPTSLLSATNIAGPYYPVPGASYSFTNTFTVPVRFFRLGW